MPVPGRDALPTVAYAILSVLARGEETGAGVTGWLRGPMSAFWAAPHSQVYPQLAALVGAGLAATGDPVGGDRRERAVYRITADGRHRLAAWVGAEPGPRTTRDELVLKVWAAGTQGADAHALRAPLSAARVGHAARLAALEGLERELADGAAAAGRSVRDPAGEAFGRWAAIRRGVGAERAYVAWCDEVLDALGGA